MRGGFCSGATNLISARGIGSPSTQGTCSPLIMCARTSSPCVGRSGCTNSPCNTPPRIAPPLCVNETNFIGLLPPYFAHRIAEPLKRLRQDLTAVPGVLRHYIMPSTNHNRMPKVFMQMIHKFNHAIFERTRYAQEIKDREVLY